MIYDNEIFKQSRVCILTIGIPSAVDGQFKIEADVTILSLNLNRIRFVGKSTYR